MDFILLEKVHTHNVKNVLLGALHALTTGPCTVLLARTKLGTERTAGRFVAKDVLTQHVAKLLEHAHAETTMKAIVVIVALKANTKWTLIVSWIVHKIVRGVFRQQTVQNARMAFLAMCVNSIAQEVVFWTNVVRVTEHAIRRNANQTLMVPTAQTVLLGYMGHLVSYPVLKAVSRVPQVQVVINANTVTGETLVNTLAIIGFVLEITDKARMFEVTHLKSVLQIYMYP
jgi:hypothetical protein